MDLEKLDQWSDSYKKKSTTPRLTLPNILSEWKVIVVFCVIAIVAINIGKELLGITDHSVINGHDYIRTGMYSTVHDPDCHCEQGK